MGLCMCTLDVGNPCMCTTSCLRSHCQSYPSVPCGTLGIVQWTTHVYHLLSCIEVLTYIHLYVYMYNLGVDNCKCLLCEVICYCTTLNSTNTESFIWESRGVHSSGILHFFGDNYISDIQNYPLYIIGVCC